MACISAACQVTVDLLHGSPYWDKNIEPERNLVILQFSVLLYQLYIILYRSISINFQSINMCFFIHLERSLLPGVVLSTMLVKPML